MVQDSVRKLFQVCGIEGDVELTSPPSADMGDAAFACFALAKEQKKNPVHLAQELVDVLQKNISSVDLIERVQAHGPYVNFFVSSQALAKAVLSDESQISGRHTIGAGKKCLVEYACPNPMKAFHIGHLRNTITGESISRILENVGYKVIRINYQGDVGMHIAKSIWGLHQLRDELEAILPKSLNEQVAFLGKAYAHGATAFEENEQAKKEILDINKKVYARDESILELYEMGREWSLEYFHTIYTRLGTHFDEFYFESEVWARGLEIVREFLAQGVFRESEGAVIFPGSEYGLHDRVFISSEGNPTYEAKDLALSERRFHKHQPDLVLHVVGKEQAEYFKVVFKALEQIAPETVGKEKHLPGGYLQTKGGKMSSRTGRVILATDLLADIEDAVREIAKERVDVIADAAVKYAILRVGVSQDVMFDVKESISTAGESGPYLLYIIARINSILEKGKGEVSLSEALQIPQHINPQEKELVTQLASFSAVTKEAAEFYDPSKVVRYVFGLAQAFNRFYETSPVLQSTDAATQQFRLSLLSAVRTVMTRGLFLLGIASVEKM